MSVGVLDAGVVLGWIRGGHRSGRKLESLFGRSRQKKSRLVISTVNLAEVLIHTWQWSRSTGGDALTLLRAFGVEIHSPDEAVTRRVAKLHTSLADGFAAATAQELNARLHTTDGELVEQLKSTRLPVSHY
jgi:predicted nucleic acid-binding protein